MSTEQLDLVVVGCGAGGLATATQFLEDRPQGRVVVLERTTRSARGGNTAWTGAFFRLEADGSPAADFADRMTQLSEGKTDRAIIDRLAELAKPTIAWLNDNGVATVQDSTYFLTSKGPRLMPAGGGGAVVERLAAVVEERGGRIVYEQTATGLLTDDRGSVVGVRTQGPDGTVREWRARTVVLACGGFEGSAEMLDRYLGEHGHELSPIAPGGRSNQGEGIAMAMAVGAQTDGQFERFHGEPVDPRSRSAEALVMVYPYGVLVDHEAQRFVDEGADTPDNTFESIAYKIWRDAHQFAYLIADQKLMRQQIARAVLTDREPEAADTLEALARRLGLDPRKLTDTIAEYNAAATPGDLDVTVLDGVATRGLTPPKSNWARPIDEPPFVAWPVTCAITFTFGGLRTDADARVIGADGAPIPGLYAVGETAGIYHHKYPGATSVLRALVFGRLTGQTAADRSSSTTAAC
ncbi:FAD-binding protein [Planosporangium thailandense]|uniref:FAD-binding protein n=1 Tax=Planosporangium thailandense TaxID=765197 RepID=A0ABX0XZB8_9ACTN|nr:FAD-binding protein [Planosporangium thailandense]NJC71398.1 FAD-binding protein [Planosporangium thailandense]